MRGSAKAHPWDFQQLMCGIPPIQLFFRSPEATLAWHWPRFFPEFTGCVLSLVCTDPHPRQLWPGEWEGVCKTSPRPSCCAWHWRRREIPARGQRVCHLWGMVGMLLREVCPHQEGFYSPALLGREIRHPHRAFLSFGGSLFSLTAKKTS